jgi:hypothetical protein
MPFTSLKELKSNTMSKIALAIKDCSFMNSLRSSVVTAAMVMSIPTWATLAQAPTQPPPIDFSGVIFGSYQYRSDSAARAQAGGINPNKFDIERVYLTFRMPAGARASIRATTDIVQNANGAYYNGWAVRLKYGYLQYAVVQSDPKRESLGALVRIGMLHTVVIDHEENFWPRYLGQVGPERFGFFSSADAGVAAQVTLPNRLGELYATVTNGPGYTSAETDRFKDVALRLSVTPFAHRRDWLQTFTVSPWFYRGETASRFAAGGVGQVGPVTDGLDRDRWGIFAGVRDPRLTIGAHYARRADGFEAGSNTLAAPRVVAPDSTGALISTYAIARPVHWNWGGNVARLGLVARWDQFTPRTGQPGKLRLLVSGVQFEPTERTALSLDYQSLEPVSFKASNAPAATATWFLHWSASF